MAAEKKPEAVKKKQITHISFEVPLNCPPICVGEKTISTTKQNKSYHIEEDGDEFVITKQGMQGEARICKSRALGWIKQ